MKGCYLFLPFLPFQIVTSFISVRRPRAALVADASTTLSRSSTKPSVEVHDIDEKLQSSNFLTTEEEDGTTVAELASPTLSGQKNVLELWTRRLITREDPFSIHKISSIAYSISAIIILGSAVSRYFESLEVYAVIPEYLKLPTYIFTISNIIMCTGSVRMAFLHRRYDLTARNGFLGTAVSSMFLGFYFLWTSPLGPHVFDNHLVTQICFAIFVLLDAGFVIDTLLSTSEIVESRRDRKADEYKGRFIVDALGYVLPVILGFLFILPTAYTDAILYDRTWFFEQCQYIDQMKGVPGMNASLCYLQVVLSLAASYGALFVTLRDKKLISKTQELAGITVFSVPAMIYTCFVTAEFVGYVEW